MQNLVLTRIDDRLIHGQVMTAWIKNRKANQVVIIDDDVANDEYMIDVLEMAIPEEIAIGIFTKEDGVLFFSQGLDAADNPSGKRTGSIELSGRSRYRYR